MGKRYGNRNRGYDSNIPEEVRDFAELDFDEYKHENKRYFDSKKELKYDYYSTLVAELPYVIEFILRKGHQQNARIQEIKNGCYEKIAGERGPEFIKFLMKVLKEDGPDSVENIKLFPIILHEIIGDILKFNESQETAEEKKESPDELFAIYSKILEKGLKKAKKKGIDENLAFDLFGVMPCKKAIKFSPFFRARGVFDIIYNYAAKIQVDFGTVVEFLFDTDDYSVVVGYALQERKEKYKNFTPGQKKVFNDINEWIFTKLESMTKDEIQDILENYIRVRKNDAANGKDGNRRYFISSLPESVYPRIYKVVQRIKNVDPDAEKYL